MNLPYDKGTLLALLDNEQNQLVIPAELQQNRALNTWRNFDLSQRSRGTEVFYNLVALHTDLPYDALRLVAGDINKDRVARYGVEALSFLNMIMHTGPTTDALVDNVIELANSIEDVVDLYSTGISPLTEYIRRRLANPIVKDFDAAVDVDELTGAQYLLTVNYRYWPLLGPGFMNYYRQLDLPIHKYDLPLLRAPSQQEYSLEAVGAYSPSHVPYFDAYGESFTSRRLHRSPTRLESDYDEIDQIESFVNEYAPPNWRDLPTDYYSYSPFVDVLYGAIVARNFDFAQRLLYADADKVNRYVLYGLLRKLMRLKLNNYSLYLVAKDTLYKLNLELGQNYLIPLIDDKPYALTNELRELRSMNNPVFAMSTYRRLLDLLYDSNLSETSPGYTSPGYESFDSEDAWSEDDM